MYFRKDNEIINCILSTLTNVLNYDDDVFKIINILCQIINEIVLLF